MGRVAWLVQEVVNMEIEVEKTKSKKQKTNEFQLSNVKNPNEERVGQAAVLFLNIWCITWNINGLHGKLLS